VKKSRVIAGLLFAVVVGGSLLLWGPTLLAEGDNVNMQLAKLNFILRTVRDNYVDVPDPSKLLEGAIRGMLEELDPHSVYIPPEDQKRINETFKGAFEGVGITFAIQNKWLTVVSPIPGTPADRLGIRAGDRITKINGVSAYGITNDQVFEKLRGPKGTSVDVTIARPGFKDPIDFTIVRDTIPIYSVAASFLMHDRQTGYVRINQFTATTDREVEQALDSLSNIGAPPLIAELRARVQAASKTYSPSLFVRLSAVVDSFEHDGIDCVTLSLAQAEVDILRRDNSAERSIRGLQSVLDSLRSVGMQRLVLDLRANPGGYLDQAWKVADLFMPRKDMMIVFTKGRTARSNQEFPSTGRGAKYDFPVIVLINHGSASASEIVSGAIQDHDRGLVIGEVSFGKGLVQTPYPMPDGSAVRITTARYYTPSGRLIQRPYDKGIAEYIMEGYDDTAPEAPPDTTPREVFHTDHGRTVYGGGGIIPDSTVKAARGTATSARLLSQRLYFECAADYAAKHPELATDFDRFLTAFQVPDILLDSLKALAKERKVEIVEEEWTRDLDFAKANLKAELANVLFNDRNLYHAVRIEADPQVLTAITLFNQARQMAQAMFQPER
jgi:C-terminal processing protease CtpA/Prc